MAVCFVFFISCAPVQHWETNCQRPPTGGPTYTVYKSPQGPTVNSPEYNLEFQFSTNLLFHIGYALRGPSLLGWGCRRIYTYATLVPYVTTRINKKTASTWDGASPHSADTERRRKGVPGKKSSLISMLAAWWLNGNLSRLTVIYTTCRWDRLWVGVGIFFFSAEHEGQTPQR